MTTLKISNQASSLGVPTIGNDFLFAQVELLSDNSIRVWYTRKPVLGTSKANDSHSYSISGPQDTLIKLATSNSVDDRSIDLFFDKDLIYGQWTLNFVTANIISDDTEGATLPSNTSCIFELVKSNKTPVTIETNTNLTRQFFNPAFLKDSQTNWRACEEALEEGRSNLEETINKITDQLYISTASSKYLQTRSSNYGITHNSILGLTDNIYRDLTITLLNDKLTLNANLDLLEVVYGVDSVKAIIVSLNEEPYRLFDGATLNILIDQKYTIPVIFNWIDFNNPLQATAQEVCFIINKYFDVFNQKAFAVPYTDAETSKTFIKIYSSSKGLRSSISIISGSSQNAFYFDSVLEDTLGPSLSVTPAITITKLSLNKFSIKINRSETVTDNLLNSIIEGDYVNIIGSEFNVDNRGSFIVEEITHYSNYSLLTCTNSNATTETVTLLTTESFIVYRPVTKQIFDNTSYSYVTNGLYDYQFNKSGYSKASIPVDTEIISRNYDNAAYLSSCPYYPQTSFYRRPDGLTTISPGTYTTGTLVEISDFIAKIPETSDFLTEAGSNDSVSTGTSDSSLFSHVTSDDLVSLTLPTCVKTLDNKIVIIGGRTLPTTDSDKIYVLDVSQDIDGGLNLSFDYSYDNTAFVGKINGLGSAAITLSYPRFYNRVLIAGGYLNGPEETPGVGYSNYLSYLYNPTTQTLEQIMDNNPGANADASLVWVSESDLAVLIGGVSNGGEAVSGCFVYDPSYFTDNNLGKWYQGDGTELLYARTNCQGVDIGSGKVLVIGGRVNNSSNTFTLTNIGTPLNICEIIEPTIDFSVEPSLASPMAYARFAFGLVKLPDNRILVVGGIGGVASRSITVTDSILDHELKSCEIYDPATNIWSQIPDTLSSHSYCTCYYDSISNRVYVYGGAASNKVEYLDLKTMTWRYSTATLNATSFRSGSAGITLDNTSVIARVGSTYDTSTDIESNGDTQFLATYNETARARVNGSTKLYTSDTKFWTKNESGSTFNINLVETQDYDLGYLEKGPYTYDSNAIYGITNTELTLVTEIPRGKGCPLITTVEDLTDLDQEGYLIVNFGYSTQVGPVRYFIVDQTTLKLDPSFDFNKEYYAGTILTIVSQKAPYLPSITEQLQTFWLTASNAGLEAAQKYLNDIAAGGIDLDIVVRYPSDRGLGNEGAPIKNNYKLSDIIEVFGPDNLDVFLKEARSV